MKMTEGEGAASCEKRVYLVRHAQSLQNVAVAQFFFNGDWAALGRMLRLGHDSPISEEGAAQLKDAAIRLNTSDGGFAKQQNVEIVVHSPYQRAVQTAWALFPQWINSSRMVSLPALHERTLTEYFFPQLLEARVRQVRSWIEGRGEKTIVLVGHGQFFKTCLGLSKSQRNVSILETTYTPESGFTPTSTAVVFEGYPDPDVRPKNTTGNLDNR